MSDGCDQHTRRGGIKTLYERVIYEKKDQEVGKYGAAETGLQIRVRVCDCSGGGDDKIRVGISRFWWLDSGKLWLPSAKSHCFIPQEAWSELGKVYEDVLAHIPTSQVAKQDGIAGCSMPGAGGRVGKCDQHRQHTADSRVGGGSNKSVHVLATKHSTPGGSAVRGGSSNRGRPKGSVNKTGRSAEGKKASHHKDVKRKQQGDEGQADEATHFDGKRPKRTECAEEQEGQHVASGERT